jgi:hypothetical protein
VSFWAWVHDVRDAMNGTGDAGQQVKELVESQREEIDRFISDAPDSAGPKQILTLALAAVGFRYASNQKLLNGLKDYGLLEAPNQPGPGILGTVTEPTLEGPEPPR